MGLLDFLKVDIEKYQAVAVVDGKSGNVVDLGIESIVVALKGFKAGQSVPLKIKLKDPKSNVEIALNGALVMREEAKGIRIQLPPLGPKQKDAVNGFIARKAIRR